MIIYRVINLKRIYLFNDILFKRRFSILKTAICLLSVFFIMTLASAQKNKEISIALVSTATGYPFSKFGKLVTNVRHPGVEIGYSFNWKVKRKHDWYQEFKLGYFYHRFVQHSIPLYTDLGYRYRILDRLTLQVALGAGYLHSIPATAKLKLTENGEYKSDKGIGRIQALAAANFGIGYIFNPSSEKSPKIFTTYQQLLQMPFVKAYVPILPYNSLMIGMSVPFKPNR